jgi:catalase-peroxidase
MADLIVLGGCAAVEAAAFKAGYPVTVPFTPGRTDASLDQTDVESFSVLEPRCDPFRNHNVTSASQLVDKAQMLTLTAPEMTVLIGGLRVLNANAGNSQLGVLTKQPEVLTTDFFVNMYDINLRWEAKGDIFEGRDYGSGELKWTGSEADLVFGSNSELRAIGEYYSWDDSRQAFVQDFAAAWSKVMNLDRFDM